MKQITKNKIIDDIAGEAATAIIELEDKITLLLNDKQIGVAIFSSLLAAADVAAQASAGKADWLRLAGDLYDIKAAGEG
jgi:hypothetical protein